MNKQGQLPPQFVQQHPQHHGKSREQGQQPPMFVQQQHQQQHHVEDHEDDFDSQVDSKVATLQPMRTMQHMPHMGANMTHMTHMANVPGQHQKPRPQRRRRLEQSHPDIVGRIIRHRWVIDGDEVYCTGTVLGISAPGTVPEDSDDGEFIPGTCYDIQYDDEDFIRHLILEGDWQCGDVQVLGRAPTMP